MPDLIPDLTQPAGWLPLVFALVMALAMLAYVILDGYDLGVGVLVCVIMTKKVIKTV